MAPETLGGGGAPRALVWATVGAVFLLMTIGNIVSATGSGLACPDWPLCHGRLIPPLRPDVLIEYSHRLTAALASILIVATSAATMRTRGTRPIGIALLALFGLQIGLGGITVLLRLPHLVSTAHLVNALLILGALLLLASPTGGRRAGPAGFARLGRAGLAVLLCQLALGGYVRHAGAGLACPDFPLCAGAVFPAHWLGMVHWTHRWLGVALLGLFIHLALASRGTPLRGGAGVTAALAVLQVTLGIVTVLWQLEPPVRALHAAVGYALWGGLVWVSARAGSWNGLVAEPPEAPGQAMVAHA
jgi:heme A synthase